MIKRWWSKYVGFLLMIAAGLGLAGVVIGCVCAALWFQDTTGICAWWMFPPLILIAGAVGSWYDAKDEITRETRGKELRKQQEDHLFAKPPKFYG